MITWNQLPFRFTTREDWGNQLNEWIGRIFYEELPEHGYELREDQIYTAYQIATAFHRERVLLAEAGLGTGKTFAYIPAAVCYARLKGRPVVIACGSPLLQQQVAGPGGDCERLAGVLGMDIDAHIADPPEEYLCRAKVPRVELEPRFRGRARLLAWARSTRAGHRRERPEFGDAEWAHLGYDRGQVCDGCRYRNSCHLLAARAACAGARDLVVCSHSYFFGELWRRALDARELGSLRWLPPFSGVVFDEGHRVPLAAAQAAGRRLSREDMVKLLRELMEYAGLRGNLTTAVLALEPLVHAFFRELGTPEGPDWGHLRQVVARSDQLLARGDALAAGITRLEDELAIEQELSQRYEWQNQKTAYEMRLLALQDQLAAFREGLAMLAAPPRETVVWRELGRDVLWAVPRNTGKLLGEHLYGTGVPVVYTSATLSTGGSFEYLERLLGITASRKARADVPFDYVDQALVYLAPDLPGREDPERWPAVAARLQEILHLAGGRSLVLLNQPQDLEPLRQSLSCDTLPFRVLWEGTAHRAELLAEFREDVPSVLIGSSFWEGVDVPGESLSACVICHLPFPDPGDPVMVARREDAAAAGLDPMAAVDIPEMALKLKQGCGRLIRKRDDRGVLCLLEPGTGTPWEEAVTAALPPGAPITTALEAVGLFLAPSEPGDDQVPGLVAPEPGAEHP